MPPLVPSKRCADVLSDKCFPPHGCRCSHVGPRSFAFDRGLRVRFWLAMVEEAHRGAGRR